MSMIITEGPSTAYGAEYLTFYDICFRRAERTV